MRPAAEHGTVQAALARQVLALGLRVGPLVLDALPILVGVGHVVAGAGLDHVARAVHEAEVGHGLGVDGVAVAGRPEQL